MKDSNDPEGKWWHWQRINPIIGVRRVAGYRRRPQWG